MNVPGAPRRLSNTVTPRKGEDQIEQDRWPGTPYVSGLQQRHQGVFPRWETLTPGEPGSNSARPLNSERRCFDEHKENNNEKK